MAAGPTHYCWHCHEPNDHAEGPCACCGQPVQAPAGSTHIDVQL